MRLQGSRVLEKIGLTVAAQEASIRTELDVRMSHTVKPFLCHLLKMPAIEEHKGLL